MNKIIQTRLIQLKYNWLHVIFWLLFPLFFALLINYLVLAIETDTKIPIAVISEEETERSGDLIDSIKSTDYLRVVDLDKQEALNQLKKNELDAVFVVKSGYERQIERGGRNRLIEAYQSDLSLAFIPITETVTSYVQQDAGRSKAFFEIDKLNKQYNKETTINLDDFIKLSKEKEKTQNLLETSLVYNNEDSKKVEESSFVKLESIWLISYLISIFLLFDWVIKEFNPPVINRFPFLKINYKHYLIYNFIIYNLGVFIISLVSLAVLNIKLSILPLFVFELSLNGLVFFIAMRFKQTYTYYAFALGAVLLVTIISGLFIPIDRVVTKFPILETLNPFTLLLQGQVFYLGIIVPLLLLVWLIRKDEYSA